MLRNDVAISVVTSVFNGEKFLARAIESILGQSFGDFEFILIDDGSTDATGSILEQYRLQDSRIQVLRQPNLGLIEALNRGCRIAKGRYIARMDADDIALTDRFRLQVEFMEKNSSIGLLGGAVEYVNAEGKTLGISRNPSGDGEIREALASCSPFWHPTVMMRREAFESVGGYRKAFVQAEDYDLWLRIAERFQMANLESAIVQYRFHPQQVSVQHRKKQVMSSMAARAAALERRKGNPDPLDSETNITEAVLANLGFSVPAQERELVENYVWTMRNMCSVGEYKAASELFNHIQFERGYTQCGARTSSDICLLAASISWHEGNVWGASTKFLKAVRFRPSILGRPLKRMASRMLGENAQSTAHT